MVNAERISLVRALKEGLQQSFVGGIIDSPYAHKICPDLISREASNPAGYIALMRGTAIGVSMRGLDNSTPCKIAEYLAMSRCVVSQPLRHELPVPLREGIELHTFRNDAEAVQVCQRLLQNPDHVQASRQAAHDYFVNNGSPRESVRRCLGLAIEHAGRTSQF